MQRMNKSNTVGTEVVFPTEDPSFNAWVSLRRTHDAISKVRDNELAQYGISVSQSAVLFAIMILGAKATPAGLSRWLIRTPHAISSILDTLEADGLIVRVKDLDRKNLVRAALTKKGLSAYLKAAKNRNTIHRIMGELTEEELQQFTAILDRLFKKAVKKLRSR